MLQSWGVYVQKIGNVIIADVVIHALQDETPWPENDLDTPKDGRSKLNIDPEHNKKSLGTL